MTHIGLVAETAETVTLRRADFERLLEAAETAIDRAALDAQDAREAELGKELARADYMTAEEVERLLAGVSPVRVWREHRGITGRALADAAGVNAAYLSDIERGKKPGSAAALVALAAVLRVAVDDLMPGS
jgi:DNA-binding XRE family transcriptional regulator